MRIDAHRHYWHFDPAHDHWITDEMALLRRDFLPGDPSAAATGVVAVQADQSIAETDFLLGLAAEHPSIRGVVGWVDLCADDLRDQLGLWAGVTALKGFRHLAQSEPDDFLARPEVIRGIATLGECGYSYDILIYPGQLAAAEGLVARCPGVRFVLDHCAKPAIARGEMDEWQRGIRRLAAHPNVWCKVSGLVTEAVWHRWTDADLFLYLEVVADAFGTERLLFGSDWPVCLVAASYAEVAGVIERWARRLADADRARLFGGTAAEVYRLEE